MPAIQTPRLTADLIARVEQAAGDPRLEHLRGILAALVVLLTERVVIEATQERRISELEHRVLFLASCLMAGDTLVPSGRFLVTSSLEELERWMSEEARALAAKLERSSSAARRRN